jgi:transposase
MAISIVERKIKGGVYISIIDGYRDPITKKPTCRTLKSFGNKAKLQAENPNFMQEIEAELRRFRSSSSAYEERMTERRGNSVAVDGEKVSAEGLGKAYEASAAPYFKLWDELDMRRYFTDVGRNYHFPWDLNKTVFYSVFARIMAPESKLSSWNNRNRHIFDFDDLELAHMYECLDVLAGRKKKIIDHLNAAIDKLYKRDFTIALYDVTTFYFESFTEGELRRRGMSKEHRTQETQVVLGLLVDSEGIPFGYELFPGNTAEVGTILKVIKDFRTHYNIGEVTVVADAGLNQLINLEALEDSGFKFIVGYPPYIKLTAKEQEQLLSAENWKSYKTEDGDLWRIKDMPLYLDKTVRPKGEDSRKIQLDARIIATFSSRRETHDLDELNKKWKKAKALTAQGLSAVNASNRSGYKSFITSNLESVELNTALYDKRKKWAGYTALLTNIKSEDPQAIYGLLRQLWRIEDNFRVLKTNLQARPVFVWTDDHIRGHFVLNYIALVMQKVLLRKLRQEGFSYSSKLVSDALRALRVIPLTRLKKANNHLYQCVSEDGKRRLPDGTEISLEEVAANIFKVCGIEPLTELETRGSLTRKFGRAEKIK